MIHFGMLYGGCLSGERQADWERASVVRIHVFSAGTVPWLLLGRVATRFRICHYYYSYLL